VASKTVAAAPGGTPRLGKKYDTFPPFAHRLDPGASQTKLGQFVTILAAGNGGVRFMGRVEEGQVDRGGSPVRPTGAAL